MFNSQYIYSITEYSVTRFLLDYYVIPSIYHHNVIDEDNIHDINLFEYVLDIFNVDATNSDTIIYDSLDKSIFINEIINRCISLLETSINELNDNKSIKYKLLIYLKNIISQEYVSKHIFIINELYDKYKSRHDRILIDLFNNIVSKCCRNDLSPNCFNVFINIVCNMMCQLSENSNKLTSINEFKQYVRTIITLLDESNNRGEIIGFHYYCRIVRILDEYSRVNIKLDDDSDDNDF